MTIQAQQLHSQDFTTSTSTSTVPVNQHVNPNNKTKKFKFSRKSKNQLSRSTSVSSNSNQSSSTIQNLQKSLYSSDLSKSTVLSTNEKKFKFKRKPKIPSYDKNQQYNHFVSLCLKHSLPYFQFFDVDNWKGPVTKVLQQDFDRIFDIFDAAQPYLKTIILNGYGFAIIKPVASLDDNNIQYHDQYFDQCRFTEQSMIPYTSDDEDDTTSYDQSDNDSEDHDESDEEIIVEQEFIAEEWVYNTNTYLLDTSTNYLYSPDTLEFMGKKTGEFSVDFNAKER